jgi:hypothetical protein
MDAGVSGCRVFGFSRQFRGEALPRVGFSRNPQRGGKGRRTETEAKSRIRRRAAGRKSEMPQEGGFVGFVGIVDVVESRKSSASSAPSA